MLNWFEIAPGRLYVVATLLPLAAFALLLAAGLIRNLCRPYRQVGGTASSLYWLLGGDRPLTSGAYLATGCMGVSAVLAVVGLVWFDSESMTAMSASRWAERVDWIRIGRQDTADPTEWAKRTPDANRPEPGLALALEVGYRIDHLSALMFAMVTVIGTGIFVFSLGYMKDETKETVEDHEVDHQSPPTAVGGLAPEHFHRRGRFSRFFLYLSLFCFSMLNLVIADNLFQVFVSWELVGVCSFFLIGFYYERPSAAKAASKAFIVNRIGDAGFLVGILIAWTYLGTLNFEELTHRVRGPDAETVVRVNPVVEKKDNAQYQAADGGSHLRLSPILPRGSTDSRVFTVPAKADYSTFGAMPYWLFVVMGIGIFLGCVGKSAQVPLHTWLPDAMEGPTPVSALIHAATMVAAGVYLVGRAYPLFAPEVLLVIAYTGAITLFVAATIALVQTDIKRVLAYSTCSQLGFMMLALGVGGWVAGLLHLLTHAFFKALLFLCSGSVIHGCHHEQDLRKMGGLRHKMPVTAFTMLVGVLAISGTPFFSGWYSKDMILASALGYGTTHTQHFLLFLLPAVTAGMTAYYMFRLWFLAFTGTPRDSHVHDHAHESPWVMTAPLVFLAACSIGIAWGWPLWDANASYLGHLLEKAQPAAVEAGFKAEHEAAHHEHMLAGLIALALAAAGAGIAFVFFYKRQPSSAVLYAPVTGLIQFLRNKWYFDEAYDAAIVTPTVQLAFATAAADKRPTDAPPPAGEAELPPRRFDLLTLDGWLNAVGQAAGTAGRWLRGLQTGQLRNYVLALALTVAALLGILTVLNAR